jgi:hypothetical protein
MTLFVGARRNTTSRYHFQVQPRALSTTIPLDLNHQIEVLSLTITRLLKKVEYRIYLLMFSVSSKNRRDTDLNIMFLNAL